MSLYRMQFNNEEIRLLIIEKIAGSIDPVDDLILAQLIKDDPGVREMWLTISAGLEDATAAGFDVNVDEQAQWMRLEPLMVSPARPGLRIIGRRLLAAASIVAVLAAGYWWYQAGTRSAEVSTGLSFTDGKMKFPTLELANHETVELHGKAESTFKAGDAVFETNGNTLVYKTVAGNNQNWTLHVPYGYDYKIRLSDGSEVWLNAATTLKFPASFQGQTREVSVEGEAFFNVSKNKESPFLVRARETEVLVTGTSFNVNTYSTGRIRTALMEGSVVLRNEGKKAVHLQPGFEADFTSIAGFETRPFDSLEVLSWLKGVYYFSNTTLKELSEAMKRMYNVESEFSNITLKGKTFSGEMRKDQPLQAFLDNINLSGDVNCQLIDGKIYFK
ncbi:FecR family protein [Flavitalea antarctica]